jgi:glycosyltransferase involved in cell wall biosynthesis
MKTVLIYRETLLARSETFIKAQAESLARYHVRFAGVCPARASLRLDHDTAVLAPGDGLMRPIKIALYEKLHFAPAFKARLKRWGADLVHAHFAPDGARAVRLARFLGVPLVVTLHGYDVTKREAIRSNYRKLWDQADLFLCVSNFIRERAIEFGFPAQKLLTQYIGVDESWFTPSDRREQEETKHVLFVGRLVEKKGCKYLIEAMYDVQRALPDALLTVVGDGPLRSSLEESATRLGVRCDFVGAQDADSIRRYLRRADVFCVPSVTAADGDSEGFGIVFIEAQAAGVPVVSFRHGGIPEAVHDGISGLLASEGNVDELARHIIRFLANDNMRLAAGEAGRKYVRARYSLTKRTAELEDIYDHVLLSRGSRHS